MEEKRKKKKPVDIRLIGIVVIAAVVLLLLIFGLRSCKGTHRSPENVVKELVRAGVDGKVKTMKKCYGVNGDATNDLQAEIDATVAYYKAHKAEKLNIKACDTLFEKGDNSYVYIVYNLVLENEQEYPCVATFMTNREDGKYYVLPPAKVTTELSQLAQESYQKFMTMDVYKNYLKEYDTFIKKNPGYEDKIAGRLV